MQKITITHHKPDPKPFVVDHVPPLGADKRNCTLRDGSRARILCADEEGPHAVVYITDIGLARCRKDGRYYSFHDQTTGDIIALDGTPADPERCTVADLEPGDFFEAGGLYLVLARIHLGFRECATISDNRGHTIEFPYSHPVRRILPGESLTITVTAEGERA